LDVHSKKKIREEERRKQASITSERKWVASRGICQKKCPIDSGMTVVILKKYNWNLMQAL
jgi:translation initiation factor RLI1